MYGVLTSVSDRENIPTAQLGNKPIHPTQPHGQRPIHYIFVDLWTRLITLRTVAEHPQHQGHLLPGSQDEQRNSGRFQIDLPIQARVGSVSDHLDLEISASGVQLRSQDFEVLKGGFVAKHN